MCVLICCFEKINNLSFFLYFILVNKVEVVGTVCERKGGGGGFEIQETVIEY